MRTPKDFMKIMRFRIKLLLLLMIGLGILIAFAGSAKLQLHFAIGLGIGIVIGSLIGMYDFIIIRNQFKSENIKLPKDKFDLPEDYKEPEWLKPQSHITNNGKNI